jgi:hypothetical protein
MLPFYGLAVRVRGDLNSVEHVDAALSLFTYYQGPQKGERIKPPCEPLQQQGRNLLFSTTGYLDPSRTCNSNL